MHNFRSKPTGWRFESFRHSLAAKGIQTNPQRPATQYFNQKYYSRRGVKRIEAQIADLQSRIDQEQDGNKRLAMMVDMDNLQAELAEERERVGPPQPPKEYAFPIAPTAVVAQTPTEERLIEIQETRILAERDAVQRQLDNLDNEFAQGNISQEEYDVRRGDLQRQLSEAPNVDEYFEIKNTLLPEVESRRENLREQVSDQFFEGWPNQTQYRAEMKRLNPVEIVDGQKVDRLTQLRMQGREQEANELENRLETMTINLQNFMDSQERQELQELETSRRNLVAQSDRILGMSHDSVTEDKRARAAISRPREGRLLSGSPERLEAIEALEREQSKRLRALDAQDAIVARQLRQVRDSAKERFATGEIDLPMYRKTLEELDKRIPQAPAQQRTTEARAQRRAEQFARGEDPEDIQPRRG